ncbi:MAG: DUF1559 domain-containing protein [Planctomycetota bacterium]|nr:MAG: DUF1559 domain-containing protein [Planctomycetota bacterium]REJ98431.1 MAG: DUF1559 domain-containing protein [Planctomycetota bacterium]REK23654.1 MAG: DUF1559 domain-containing protein [Planctomycetota bacterium]REK31119.1 MAG: DUF1559 domain-containing protein [Planctomycetota bacterium]
MPRENASSRRGESTRTVVFILAIVGLGSLLLCGAIGAVAVGLPAWQQAREAARRQEARRNLREINRALEQYHDTPAGGPVNDTLDNADQEVEPATAESP